MASITVRLATKDDAELIAKMSRETFIESFAQWNTKENMDKFMNEVFTMDGLVAEVGEKENIFLLAFMDEQPAGYVRMRTSKEEEGIDEKPAIEIARIYSARGMTSLGIGSVMMQACLDHADALGFKTIWLGVWENNEGAIRFYERWKFRRFSEHPFILGDDIQNDWLMKRMVRLPA